MKSDLVGVWSADALFSPGSQENEIVVFRSDGAGWREWRNLGEHHVELFSWLPTSPGWYVLSSEGLFERDSHNLSRDINWNAGLYGLIEEDAATRIRPQTPT